MATQGRSYVFSESHLNAGCCVSHWHLQADGIAHQGKQGKWIQQRLEGKIMGKLAFLAHCPSLTKMKD